MGMPDIPDIRPKIEIDKEDVISLLLISIALEEISLAHLVNAEALKLQEAIEKKCKFDEMMEVNEAVVRALKTVIKKEMLLQFKFENILDLMKDKDKCWK
jgi:PP-loop superfamily ATP-utilizing enzyme